MPVQIIMTEGLVSKEGAQKLHAEVSEVFMDVHNVSGNSFMLPNIIGEVIFVEKGLTFSGKQPKDIAIVELRAPSFTFTESPTQRQQFVERVTKLVQDATGLPIEQIWVNAVHAVDGLWGIGGKAYSNEELGAAISAVAKCKVA